MAGLVHRDYSKEFVKVGDTITIRKPAKFVAKNFTGTTSTQDITDGSVTVKMDRFRDVTFEMSSRDQSLAIDEYSNRYIQPAMRAIAQAIDADCLAVGVQEAGKAAAISSTPALSDIAGVGKALDQSNAPKDNRHLVMPAEIQYKFNTLDNFAKQCYAGDSKALRDSEVGKVYSCETFSSENCPQSSAPTAGTATAYKVVGTKGATEFTVSAGAPATGTIKKGDQLIVNGYLYTCTEDLTLASGAGTLKVDQNIPETISTAVSAKIISKAHALGFHRNGIALVTRQLDLPLGNKNAYIASTENGLGVRVVFDYNASTKSDTVSIDIIYGVAKLDANLLVDFA